MPGVKREGSEVPLLKSIPTQQPAAVSRGGGLKSTRFSQREVDLTAMPKRKETKLKKKVQVEEELKHAISALKKPNRILAGRCFMEAAEQRTNLAGAGGRKSKKPVRSPFAQGVQVWATPKRNRMQPVEPQVQHSNDANEGEMSVMQPSSVPRVPLSVSHSSQLSLPTMDSKAITSPSRLSGQDLVFDLNTPSRRQSLPPGLASQKLVDIENPPSLQSSPRDNIGCIEGIGFKAPASVSHPNKHELPTLLFSSVQETPSRRRKMPLHSQSSITLQREPQSQDVQSSPGNIYRSLGWDDVDELA
jgi:hypothetical protein